MVPEETRNHIFSKRKEVSKSQEQFLELYVFFSEYCTSYNGDKIFLSPFLSWNQSGLVIAMKKLFSKLLNPINLDSDQLNSSEGEFDFSLLNDQITSIYEAIVNETNESNGQVTNLIIDSETAEDGVGSQWVRYEDFKKVPPGVQFVSGQKRVGLQITSNIKEQVDSLRLVKKIVSETNNYAKRNSKGKTLSSSLKNSSWPICKSIGRGIMRPDLPVSMRIPIHLYEMMLDKIPGAQTKFLTTFTVAYRRDLKICLFNSYILYKLGKKKGKERPLTYLRYLKALVTLSKISLAVDIKPQINVIRALRMHFGDCFVKYHTKNYYKV
ncbi:piggyBac transposable element-derived protein 4-like [Vespula maculifrons]|uniref:PiggyBac transposable element-derived protein 4-like n=1 Tax=Vespula maculifrons TaxID=7453 RepID=A0ABD2AQK9_VESMC